jgi:hypothetical protein
VRVICEFVVSEVIIICLIRVFNFCRRNCSTLKEFVYTRIYILEFYTEISKDIVLIGKIYAQERVI